MADIYCDAYAFFAEHTRRHGSENEEGTGGGAKSAHSVRLRSRYHLFGAHFAYEFGAHGIT